MKTRNPSLPRIAATGLFALLAACGKQPATGDATSFSEERYRAHVERLSSDEFEGRGPGTGGEQKATLAELYVLDLGTRRVVWHQPLLAGVREYTALCALPDGRVLGVADQRRLFAFDPQARRIVHEQDLEPQFGLTTSQQGPRVFVSPAEDGRVFLLLRCGIAAIDPQDLRVRLLARAPVNVGPGGDFLDGRIYFGSGSHLYSFAVPAA